MIIEFSASRPKLSTENPEAFPTPICDQCSYCLIITQWDKTHTSAIRHCVLCSGILQLFSRFTKNKHCLCLQLFTQLYCIYFKIILSSFPQDVFYHFIALLLYFAAFVLEAATTAANGGAYIKPLPNSTDTVMCITYPRGNIFTVLSARQYSINVAATVSAIYVFKLSL